MFESSRSVKIHSPLIIHKLYRKSHDEHLQNEHLYAHQQDIMNGALPARATRPIRARVITHARERRKFSRGGHASAASHWPYVCVY